MGDVLSWFGFVFGRAVFGQGRLVLIYGASARGGMGGVLRVCWRRLGYIHRDLLCRVSVEICFYSCEYI